MASFLPGVPCINLAPSTWVSWPAIWRSSRMRSSEGDYLSYEVRAYSVPVTKLLEYSVSPSVDKWWSPRRFGLISGKPPLHVSIGSLLLKAERYAYRYM